MNPILLAAALAPSVVLGALILKMDWFESEPRKTLALVFGLGCLSCIPAGILEGLCQYVLQMVALPAIVFTILMFFFVVPLSEEGCKYCAMGIVGKRPEYNCVFDGVVYGAVAALGFATLENIGYVYTSGTLSTAIFRAVTAVPMHCSCGVFMGYFYSEARIRRDMGDQQGCTLNKRKAILLPALFHGVYDTLLGLAGVHEIYFLALVALVLTIGLFVYAVKRVKESSRNDRPFASAGPVQPTPMAGAQQQLPYQQAPYQQQYPQQMPNQQQWQQPYQQVTSQQQWQQYPQQQVPNQQQWQQPQQQVPSQWQQPQQQVPGQWQQQYPQQPQQQNPGQWPQQPPQN